SGPGAPPLPARRMRIASQRHAAIHPPAYSGTSHRFATIRYATPTAARPAPWTAARATVFARTESALPSSRAAVPEEGRGGTDCPPRHADAPDRTRTDVAGEATRWEGRSARDGPGRRQPAVGRPARGASAERSERGPLCESPVRVADALSRPRRNTHL